ncbi:MAG: SRPBCC family protein [Chitinophagaceae bacterium]|nr:SRPBCC family protein [Chitinophagaceae bacterium]
MAFYQLITRQKLPVSIQKVWGFISSPYNLKEITPKHMGFVVTSNSGNEKMYPGMIITYTVSPLLGIKLSWMTEITQVKENEYFIDEQRIGPYSLWHHEHKIEPIDGGTLMTDIITYQPPLGFLGAVANSLFIKKQLGEIFDYRKTALEKRFGKFE